MGPVKLQCVTIRLETRDANLANQARLFRLRHDERKSVTKRILLPWLAMALIALLLSSERGQAGRTNPVRSIEDDPPNRAIPNVLYLTHSAGFKHDVLPLSEQILKQIGERSG